MPGAISPGGALTPGCGEEPIDRWPKIRGNI
jgi:hypothetical protein